MTRVWYCADCGYEVHSRGRCHNCRQKLVASAMPELEAGPEDEEVGYRLDGWDGPDRGRLIAALNDLGVHHRFEGEELVVEVSDEERVDDLVAAMGDGTAGAGPAAEDAGAATALGAPEDTALDDLDRSGAGPGPYGGGADGEGSAIDAGVRLLADAAARLRQDPTDMQADADVAEASTSVFLVDRWGPFDEDTWSAVGRVTRRLLALLGADEALEEGIRAEASVLERLLTPVGNGPAVPTGDAATSGNEAAPGERTVYGLADWLPEQRASLSILLDGAGIAHEWEGEDLLVPADREDTVEELFGQVEGFDSDTDDGDGTRYEAVAELFAASGRLAGDPGDESKRDAVVEWAGRADGPPLLGMDDVDWFRIVNRARSLVGAIEADDGDRIHDEASTLHDLLRAVV